MIHDDEGASRHLPNHNSNNPPDETPLTRNLKIEADGDGWKGITKPKIRLNGRWLERAGFAPGSRVLVTCVAPGVIHLQSTA